MRTRTGLRRALAGALAGLAATATGTPVAVTKYSHTSQPGDCIGQGTNAQAERSAGAGVAGLDVFGNGRGCNTDTGELTVTRLARNTDGGIKAFAATFTQHCEGADAALRGTIRYFA